MIEKLDVLIVGSGIAGIISAIEAASNGASVAIACAGPLFGGSSFYPGTWGLGLVAPESEADEDDLIATIESVGRGVTSHALVETFVRNLKPSIEWLEADLGVTLMRPSNDDSAHDATFIPCFDHKNRLWRGIARETFREAAERRIAKLGIRVLERCELMEIVCDEARAPLCVRRDTPSPLNTRNDTPSPHSNGDAIFSERGDDPTSEGRFFRNCTATGDRKGAVCGAVLFDRKGGGLFTQPAGAIVLCCGGTGGLFERSLTSHDVLSSAHSLAMDVGCELANIEFMQMMPGLVSPVRGTVFNEKTFRYAIFDDRNGILPTNESELENLLEMRSGHGPFTCRLGDEAVDMAIDAAGDRGISVKCDFPKKDTPEFVMTFSNWMQNELGISPADEMRVAMYAHAANGGIRIDTRAWTGVLGLYACGEMTGGMHGADRIGGLSSANSLVFGRIAGRCAAVVSASEHKDGARDGILDCALKHMRANATPLDDMDANRIVRDMRKTMSTHAMIKRTHEGLSEALEDLKRLQKELEYHGDCRSCVIAADASIARGIRTASQLKLAHAMLSAMRSRAQSLGSHYRVDSCL